MKMKYKIGNLVNATEDIILHGCNAQGAMRSGVAKAIRAKWPGCYDVYKKQYDTYGLNLGNVIWYTTPNFKLVGNAITQEYYGRNGKKYMSYDAVDDAFQTINHYAKSNGVSAVALPAIGAGLGGGDWDVIKTIIEQRMTYATPVLYVLENEASNFVETSK